MEEKTYRIVLQEKFDYVQVSVGSSLVHGCGGSTCRLVRHGDPTLVHDR